MQKKWLFVMVAGFISIIIIFSLHLKTEEEVKPLPKEATMEYSAPVVTEPVNVPELPSEEDLIEAQDVAAAFVAAFHPVNPEDPYEYVEAAKPFMTARMYSDYSDIPKRATLTDQGQEIVDVEVWANEVTSTQQVYRIGVTDQGEQGASFTGYLIKVVKQNGLWKVDGVNVSEG